MKTSIINGMLWILLIGLNLSSSFAQDADSEEPAPGSSITPNLELLSPFKVPVQTPIVKSSSVIFYSDGLSLAIEFEPGGLAPSQVILVDKNNATDSKTLTLSGGKVEFTGTASGKTYDIKALGDDGQLYVVGTINTTPFQAGAPVIVSEKLYRALSLYVANETQTVTLSNYLKQLPEVSQHEKISFLQRYVMNGAVLPASIKGQYPDAYVKLALSARQLEGECICNFVMNQVTVVIPDETGNNDFAIGPKTSQTGPNMYNNSSYWLRGITAQGPAKNQLLVNEGKTAGNKKRTETWVNGGETISDNYVRIGYHLMCIGITELPKECDCEKSVSYDYGYSTKVEARTNTGGFGCVWKQFAASLAQDWAVAVVTRENVNNVNDVQVLQSGLGIAKSTCEGGVPVSVLLDAARIGTSVFQLIKSVKTAQLNDVINQTNQIIDKVEEVLLPLTEAKNCDNAMIEKPLLQGQATFTFHPNDPLSFIIMSGSSLEVTGLRCWSSLVSIKSSFHLAGVVSGGAPNASTPHCCTNYFSNWAYASQNGDENSRKNYINGHLALRSPGGWQTINGFPNPSINVINIPTAIGYAIGVKLPNGQTCAKEIPIFNNPH